MSSGLPLARERISGSWPLTRWLWHWDLTSVKGCHSSMPSQDVTPFQASEAGGGEKKAWQTWTACDEVTDVTAAFCALAASPSLSAIDNHMDALERFVVLLYDRTSSHEHVNECRKHLFTQTGRSIDAFPPTREAPQQHPKRAAYQAGYCWGQMMVSTPELPSPSDWGGSTPIMAGTYTGQPSQKQLRHVGNY